MARKHAGGIITPTGFRIENPSPIDDRLVVDTLDNLTSSVALPNVYGGILVAIADSNYDLYKWNGNDRTDLANWSLLSGSGGSGGASDSSLSASFASSSTSASFASTASFTLTSISSSFALTARTASHALNSLLSTSSSFAITASHVLNLDISSLSKVTQSFDGNRPISTAQIPDLFGVNPYINAYDSFNEDSSSISDFLEAVFYPPIPNRPPLITSNDQVSINEFEFVSKSFVHFITAEDQAILGDATTLDTITTFRTQSNYTDDFFRIDNPSIGKITLTTTALSSMNSPGGQHSDGPSHQFHYEVGDSRGAFTRDTLFIRVIPDSKPVFTTDNDPTTGLLVTVNEFDFEGVIATIEGTDVENGVTFRISSNNTDGFFSVGEHTGLLSINTKLNRTMNTDLSTGAYPLDIEIVDQFGQFNVRTFYIKIKPNSAPDFRQGSATGNPLIINHEIILLENTSGPGTKEIIFATNADSLDGDNIIIETGSDVPDTFKNDFNIYFQNTDLTYETLDTTTPSILISQSANTLNPDVTPEYQFFLTASDEHHQSGDDTNDPTFLNLTIKVVDNLDPIYSPSTQSLSINEKSDEYAPTNPSEITAIDPDNSENPLITNLTLKGAFFKDGGFLPSNINTDLHLPNLTESLGGTSNLDPHSNPFQFNSFRKIERKSNVILNSDIANLYEYEVTLGGGGKGILQIRILDHVADPLVVNWDDTQDGTPYIIESALQNDFLRANENGLDGTKALISFQNGNSHEYIISSSNDFIETPPQGPTAELKLKKHVSESNFTRNNTIELEVTASQTDFPTTIQKRKYTINISPNNSPTLTVEKNLYANNQTTNGTQIPGQNILAHIQYSNPDIEGDAPDFDSFTFEGNNLTTVLDATNNIYEIRSTGVSLPEGEYPFTATLKDIHGFAVSSISDVITISDAIAPIVANNATQFHGDLPGLEDPLFFILESADTSNNRNKVVKELHGRPVDGTQAKLTITYLDSLENNVISAEAFVGANSSIFSTNITNNQIFISAGSGFNSQNYQINQNPIQVIIEYTSNASVTRSEIIFIKVIDNTAPNASITVTDNLASVVGANTTLLQINPTDISTQTNEGDIIQNPTVVITGSDDVAIANTVTKIDNNYVVKNNSSITTATPEGNNYTTEFSSNSEGNFVFYIVEGSQINDNIVIESNGVSNGKFSSVNVAFADPDTGLYPNTQADIDVNYLSVNVQNYNYNFDLSDNANQSRNFTGNISISPPTAQPLSSPFGISVGGDTSKFSINADGKITVGSGFNYEFDSVGTSDVIIATVTASDNFGNHQFQDITINITENHAPTFNINQIDFPSLVSPVNDGTDIIIFNENSLADAANDKITVTHNELIGGSSIIFPFVNEIEAPYDAIKIKVQNAADIVNPTPPQSEYDANISNNSIPVDGQQKFFIIETATPGFTNARNNINGIGGDPAKIEISYETPPSDTYAYGFTLKDDTGQQNTSLAGNLTVAHTQSTAVHFGITTSPPNQFQINSEGIISAGPSFINNANDVSATVKITNSYGHEHTTNVIIDIAPNQPPQFTATSAVGLQAPITANAPLINVTGVSDPESDNITNIVVSITKNGIPMTNLNIPTTPITPPYPTSFNISCSDIIVESGTYDFEITLTDANDNSLTKTGTISIVASDPKVYLYKWGAQSTLSDLSVSNIPLGIQNNGVPYSTANTFINNFINNDDLAQSFTPIFNFGGAPQEEVVFLGELSLSDLDDFDGTTVANNVGISQLGYKNYNQEVFIVVFPTSMNNEVVPTSMYAGAINNLSEDTTSSTTTYYLWELPGLAVSPSKIVTFTRNGDEHGLILTTGKKSGNKKFYLIPDDFTDTQVLDNLT
tara:strand:- start:10498 stop:16059 length:5562 start_codon:yes stop_codon:yes gene_type:complete